MIFEIEYSLENISNAVKQLLEANNQGPKIWLFRGEMGAGKTTLVKEIGQQLKIKSIVQSPTFSLVNPYETESGEIIYHFDLYRLENVHEAIDIGIEEYLDSGHLCFIEWPERAEILWNIPHVNIEIINLTEFSRKLTSNWQS
jgi:tRNA threonylcarbamoyladenosine biosynthesis protein TsaE